MRARREHWSTAPVPSQAGRLAVITGGDSGLGFEAAKVLAGAGADLVLASRDLPKAEAAATTIRRAAPRSRVSIEPIDLAEQASVAAFAAGRIADGRPIDLLINNAGIMMVPERVVTVDGFELQLATNFLGHYALTGLLLDLVRAGDGPRVVWASSVASRWGRIRLDDLQSARRYSPHFAYARSKLACLMAAVELDRRSTEAGWGIMSLAAHPGFSRTALQVTGPRLGRGDGFSWSQAAGHLPGFSQTATEGARGLVRAATDPHATGGIYFGPTRSFGAVGPPHRVPILAKGRDKASIDALWREAERLTGVRWAETMLRSPA